MLGEPIKAVIFDLGKVIVDFDHHTISSGLSRFSPYSEDVIFRTIFSSGFAHRFDSGRISPEDFYAQLKNKLCLSASFEQVKSIWNNIFSLQSGIDSVIEQLSGSFTLVCLSNTNIWHFTHCREKFPVLDRFNAFVLSYEVGVCKPDPQIYHYAICAAGTRPETCIYIDDIPEFVTAGEAIGLRGIHFVSVAQLVRILKDMGIIAPCFSVPFS